MEEETRTEGQTKPSLVPVAWAIVFVGGLIALSIYMVFKPVDPQTLGVDRTPITVEPVNENDHILGNPNAPVVIIEYSDLDCRFCRTFHVTMKQIMSVYGAEGKVAWVYRHFPIVELHKNAPVLAEASECVNEFGGNDAFWKFVDGVFTSPSASGQFEMDRLDAIAAIAGVPAQQFRTCLESGKYKEKVQKHFEEAVAAGGQGTPHNVIIAPGMQPISVPGAQPYATIKSIIDSIVNPN